MGRPLDDSRWSQRRRSAGRECERQWILGWHGQATCEFEKRRDPQARTTVPSLLKSSSLALAWGKGPRRVVPGAPSRAHTSAGTPWLRAFMPTLTPTANLNRGGAGSAQRQRTARSSHRETIWYPYCTPHTTVRLLTSRSLL